MADPITMNRLAASSSAYLRSAAHQPIDWQEFGPEAFKLAKETDRPILLDIGAVWCHWCHVIDRESYENEEIAALINQYYVPVKVDRDQRPDVDARYQELVQSMTGQGGWPLTAFLTHDGRLIYGGTYFPPTAMKNLLIKIQELYHERKAEIFRPSESLDEATLRRLEAEDRAQIDAEVGLAAEVVSDEKLNPLCNEFLEQVLQSVQRAFDPTYGGFGSQPKFPHFSTLSFLIAWFTQHPEQKATYEPILSHTLTRMALGGIYDQVAGGFHRYSVDERWHVPHFEKMAYDNAEALTAYAQAYRYTGNELYRKTAVETIDWVNQTLSDQAQGGFYASQDADINLHDDGDHFTWSPEELRAILTPQETEVVSRYYNISAEGDMHHAVGRNVLMVQLEKSDLAQQMGIPLPQVETLLASAHEKMRQQRQLRLQPFVDTTLYTNWNGMQISAYFEAADLLDLPEARAFAKKSLNRVLELYYQPGQAVLHAEGVEGFLDDYAWLAWACVKGYQSTGEDRFLTVAQDIATLMRVAFEDERLGGFFDIRVNEDAIPLLQARRKPTEDNPSSSANAMAIRVLQALAAITDSQTFDESIHKGLNLLIHLKGNMGLFISALATATLNYLTPPMKLTVEGNEPALNAAARAVSYPEKRIQYKPAEMDGKPSVIICEGHRCLPPAHSVSEFEAQMQSLKPSRA